MANTRHGQSGKTSPALFRPTEDVTLSLCLRRSQKPKFLFLAPGAGQTPEWLEAEALTSLGACTTPNILERHSDAGESFLSGILEANAPEKYYLSPRACAGILRRAERRGKALPPMLHKTLTARAQAAL